MCLSQSHIARKWQNQSWNSGLLTLGPSHGACQRATGLPRKLGFPGADVSWEQREQEIRTRRMAAVSRIGILSSSSGTTSPEVTSPWVISVEALAWGLLWAGQLPRGRKNLDLKFP